MLQADINADGSRTLSIAWEAKTRSSGDLSRPGDHSRGELIEPVGNEQVTRTTAWLIRHAVLPEHEPRMWVKEKHPVAEVVVEDDGAIRPRNGEAGVVKAART
jgi:hypothetical protein